MKVGVIGQAGVETTRLADAGFELIARPSSDEHGDGFKLLDATLIAEYQAFWDHLEHPRVIVIDMPPGAGVDHLIDEAYETMEPADVVIDTTGSYWCDTLRRYRRMRHRALYYIDVAWVERNGQCLLLAGGDVKAINQASKFLISHCANFQHIGGPGIAHYAAVIEESMANAVAHIRNEAALMMEAWPAMLNEESTKQLWPLVERPGLGRAAWQLDDAVQLEAATPLLAQTVMQSISDSLDDHNSSAPPPRVGPFQHPDEIM